MFRAFVHGVLVFCLLLSVSVVVHGYTNCNCDDDGLWAVESILKCHEILTFARNLSFISLWKMEGDEGRADSAAGKVTDEEENKKKKKRELDLEFLTCCLQPLNAESDPSYVRIRRLLLYRKAQSGIDSRKDWKCNGRSYVAYRNYIRRPRNWESLMIPSQSSTPNQSGRWAPSASPISLLFDMESWSSSRDLRTGNPTLSHRTSFSSSMSDAIVHYVFFLTCLFLCRNALHL